jgi:hypothetical protein
VSEIARRFRECVGIFEAARANRPRHGD